MLAFKGIVRSAGWRGATNNGGTIMVFGHCDILNRGGTITGGRFLKAP